MIKHTDSYPLENSFFFNFYFYFLHSLSFSLSLFFSLVFFYGKAENGYDTTRYDTMRCDPMLSNAIYPKCPLIRTARMELAYE